MTTAQTHSDAFDSVEDAIADIAAGKMVIVTDDEARENEGDLVMAASKASTESINQMILHARGLICVPMMGHQLRKLGISPMASQTSWSTPGTYFHYAPRMGGSYNVPVIPRQPLTWPS